MFITPDEILDYILTEIKTHPNRSRMDVYNAYKENFPEPRQFLWDDFNRYYEVLLQRGITHVDGWGYDRIKPEHKDFSFVKEGETLKRQTRKKIWLEWVPSVLALCALSWGIYTHFDSRSLTKTNKSLEQEIDSLKKQNRILNEKHNDRTGKTDSSRRSLLLLIFMATEFR